MTQHHGFSETPKIECHPALLGINTYNNAGMSPFQRHFEETAATGLAKDSSSSTSSYHEERCRTGGTKMPTDQAPGVMGPGQEYGLPEQFRRDNQGQRQQLPPMPVQPLQALQPLQPIQQYQHTHLMQPVRPVRAMPQVQSYMQPVVAGGQPSSALLSGLYADGSYGRPLSGGVPTPQIQEQLRGPLPSGMHHMPAAQISPHATVPHAQVQAVTAQAAQTPISAPSLQELQPQVQQGMLSPEKAEQDIQHQQTQQAAGVLPPMPRCMIRDFLSRSPLIRHELAEGDAPASLSLRKDEERLSAQQSHRRTETKPQTDVSEQNTYKRYKKLKKKSQLLERELMAKFGKSLDLYEQYSRSTDILHKMTLRNQRILALMLATSSKHRKLPPPCPPIQEDFDEETKILYSATENNASL